MDFQDKTQPTMDPRQAPNQYFLPILVWKRQLNLNIPKILYFLFSFLGLLKPCASVSPESSLSLGQQPLSSPLCKVSIFLLSTFLQVCHEVYALLQALNSLLKIFKNILIECLSFILKVMHFSSTRVCTYPVINYGRKTIKCNHTNRVEYLGTRTIKSIPSMQIISNVRECSITLLHHQKVHRRESVNKY